MVSRRGFVVGLGSSLSACALFPPHLGASSAAGPGFLTLHTFTLSSPEELEELSAILADFNRLFGELGARTTGYRLWESESEGGGPTRYVWESTWDDSSAYDEAHASDAYQALLRRTMPSLSSLLKDHSYLRCRELPIPGPRGQREEAP